MRKCSSSMKGVAPNTLLIQVGAKLSIGASKEDARSADARVGRRSVALQPLGRRKERAFGPRAGQSHARASSESLRHSRDAEEQERGGGQGAAPGGGPGGQLHSRARPSLSASPPRGVTGLTLLRRLAPARSLTCLPPPPPRSPAAIPPHHPGASQGASSPRKRPDDRVHARVPRLQRRRGGVRLLLRARGADRRVHREERVERRARLRRAHHRLHKLHQRRRGDAPDRPPPRRPRGFHPRERRRRRQHGPQARARGAPRATQDGEARHHDHVLPEARPAPSRGASRRVEPRGRHRPREQSRVALRRAPQPERPR